MIDHIVYGVHDLEGAVGSINSLTRVTPSYGGPHVGLGTANYLCSLGESTYLEIIGPDPSQPGPEQARPFGLERMMTAGVITWCARTDDLDGVVARAAEAGLEYDEPIAMQRRSPGGLLSWRLSFPRFDTRGGIVPFFIDWGDSPHPATTAAKGLSLVSMHGVHPSPDRATSVLASLGLDLEVRRGPEPGLAVRVQGPGGEIPLRVASFL
jgi:hypothetical protein